MVTSYKDDYGRTYYIDPNTGKKIGKKEAYLQAGTMTDPTTGQRVDIGDTGDRTGTGIFGMAQGKGVQGSGDHYQRQLVREEIGVAPTAEIERKELKDTRIKYAKARRADRRLQRIEERDASKARKKGYKEGQQSLFKSLGAGDTRKAKLQEKSQAINTGEGGKRTQEDAAKAAYFEDLKSDREDTAWKKFAEVVIVAATAGVAGAAGGGAGATSAAAGSGGSTAAMTTGGATFTGGSTLAAGSIPAGATSASAAGISGGTVATVGGTGATLGGATVVKGAAGSSSAAMTSGGATFTGGSTLASGSVPAGATSASASGISAGTTATAGTSLTTGQKLVQALDTGKEYYDQAKPYIDAAKNISGALSGGEGGATTPVAGQPQQQRGQLNPALFASAQGQAAATPTPQAGLSTTPQVEQTEMMMVPSMAGLSGGMQPQGNLKQQDNYNLSNFVNPTTMQNIYAEKGGRVKEETNYDKNLLEEGGRNKRA